MLFHNSIFPQGMESPSNSGCFKELTELEAAQKIGAARYERAEGRLTQRNGARERLLSTKAGDGRPRAAHPESCGGLSVVSR